MGWGRCVGLVQVGVYQRVAGEAEYSGAVGEEIDILRADDTHELERWFAFDGRGSLTLCLTGGRSRR
jgi:hypothetical protein